MHLKPAKDESDWPIASKILNSVVDRLEAAGNLLWTKAQVSVDRLKNSYQLEDLHFIVEEGKLIGVVFLLTSDPIFWPEVAKQTSLFFHKLAILPSYSGMGKGNAAIKLIVNYASKRGFQYIRVDCDDREKLESFYQANGFTLVSKEKKGTFNIIKFELSLTISERKIARI